MTDIVGTVLLLMSLFCYDTDRQIENLGSKNWREREVASVTLQQRMDYGLMTRLWSIHAKTTDLEVKHRIENLAEGYYRYEFNP